MPHAPDHFSARPSHDAATPFASAFPPPAAAPATLPVCPKCGWHQPDGARMCAACGVIFAKYAEAERRRRARAMTAALAPEPVRAMDSRDDDAVGDHGDGHGDGQGGGDGGGGPRRPVDVGVGEVISGAVAGAIGAVWPLVALQMAPMVVALGLGLAAATMAPGLMALSGRAGLAPMLIVGGLALLVVVRVAGGILAGGLVAVDDVMQGGFDRGVVQTILEGWGRGGAAVAGSVLVGLAMLVPALPLAGAAFADVGSGGLLVVGILSIVGMVVVGLRLALVLPLMVLGGRDVASAFSESWSLTGRSLWTVAATLIVAALISVAVSMATSMVAIIPVLGWIAAIVAQAILQGFSLAVVAGLFRRLA